MTPNERQTLIEQLKQFPAKLEVVVSTLDDKQLDTPYRDGGWTVRQVVHHIADSHMNAFIRMKLVMLEDHPTLKPYDQDVWSRQADSANFPIQSSLGIINGLHARMGALLENVQDWNRTAYHPENGDMSIEDLLRIYGKHGDHHLQQILDLKDREKW